MTETTKHSVSIIIPVYNGGTNFAACMESLKALDPQPLEIIVAADGDTDGSSETARKQGLMVLRSPERLGPANARNRGAQKASGDILFFLDADVAATACAVGRVAENFHDDPGLAACFGSYDDSPAESGFLSQYRNLLHHHVHQTGNRHAATFWAGCGAVRREVFLSLKGFDASYQRPSIEDIELGYRLRKQGCRILLDKGLLVKHYKKWTIRNVLSTDIFDRALPWTRLILSEGGFIDDLNLKVPNRLSVIFVFLLLLSLAMGPISTVMAVPAISCALLLVGLNLDLYRLFLRKRGVLFATGAVFWHWLYYLFSGLSFGIGLCEFGLRKIIRRYEREPKSGRSKIKLRNR